MTMTMPSLCFLTRPRAAVAAAAFQMLLSLSLTQAADTWDGGGDDDLWSNATNWAGDVAVTLPASLSFAGGVRLTPTNDLTGATVTNLTFAAGAGAFALWGNSVTLGGNVSVGAGGSVTNDQTINLPLALSKSVTLSAAPVGGSTSAAKGALVFNGEISGPFGLTSTGKNYVQLNGSNTYSGDTVITGGDASFSIGHPNAFGSGKLIVGATPGESQMWIQSVGNKTVTNAVEIRTGRFISAGYTVATKAAGNLTLAGDILLNQGTSGDFWCQKELTLSGPVSGGSAYGLRLASGKLILQGVNTFTNHVRTTGSGTTFNINSDAALGHTNNAFLTSFNVTFQTASATSIALAPSRMFSITIPTNTITFDVPTGSSLTIPGLVTNSGLIAKSGAGALTLSGRVANGGGLSLSAGALTLSGVNTYGGGTTLKGGTLNITTNAALGAINNPLTFTTSATLQAGDTNVSVAADRTLYLTNASAYTATLDVPTNFSMAIAGAFVGNVGTNSLLTKTGPGTLILTGGTSGSPLGGLSVLGGKVSIQGGVWQVAPAQTADGTVFNVLGGATYEQTGGTNTLPIYSCISQQYIGGASTNLTSVGILSGGLLTGMELMVGRRNSAVMTISGDALLDLYSFKLGELPGFTTVCNLDGGVVDCNYIATRDTNSPPQTKTILNFNGGTLRAKNTSGTPNLIGGYGSGSISFLTSVNVKSGGAVIDSRSYAVTIPQVMSHDPVLGDTPDGGLTKRGTGSLTLSTTNTYTGVTSVEAGTLKLNAAANTLWPGGSVLVASNAVFDVNGKPQTLAGLGGSGLVTNNSLLTVTLGIAPGGTNAIGRLTLAATPAALGGTLLVDVADDGACDRLHVKGDLTLTNLTLTVADTNALNKANHYVIASYAGSLTGPFSSSPLPERWQVKHDTAAREIFLSYDFGTLIMLR